MRGKQWGYKAGEKRIQVSLSQRRGGEGSPNNKVQRDPEPDQGEKRGGPNRKKAKKRKEGAHIGSKGKRSAERQQNNP